MFDVFFFGAPGDDGGFGGVFSEKTLPKDIFLSENQFFQPCDAEKLIFNSCFCFFRLLSGVIYLRPLGIDVSWCFRCQLMFMPTCPYQFFQNRERGS